MDKIYEQQFKRARGMRPLVEETKIQGRKVAGGVWLLPALIPSPRGGKKRKGPPQRDYQPVPFTLRRETGLKGRHAYENVQKLEVLNYSRQISSNGEPVGKNPTPKVPEPDPKYGMYIPKKRKNILDETCAHGSNTFWRSSCR